MQKAKKNLTLHHTLGSKLSNMIKFKNRSVTFLCPTTLMFWDDLPVFLQEAI